MRKYKGIDIGRVVFACLIPILHVALPESSVVYIIRQYISRLGVPFFFVISGMFLYKSIEKYGAAVSLKRYLIRVGRLLLIWLLIYSPILLYTADSYMELLHRILFKTPAFLWYLTALLVASIPFCMIKNRKVLYAIATVLYVLGTLFGETYKCILGGWPCYENVFLTTRNGVFFGLPLMCVGEITWLAEKKSMLLLFISGLAMIFEITFIGFHADKLDDRSMYILLPIFIYSLVLFLKDWNPIIDTEYLGGISSAIYVMQFRIITAGTIVLRKIGLNGTSAMWLVYVAVIIIPVIFYLVFRKEKIVKIIF